MIRRRGGLSTQGSGASRRALQIATGVLALVPVATGLLTLLGIADPVYADAGLPRSAMFDSNLRFFGGLWLALGLAVFWLIPRIEAQTVLFRVLWGMIFVGGIGRLLSMLLVGLPPAPFIAFTVLEIVGAPVFIAWQSRLERRHSR